MRRIERVENLDFGIAVRRVSNDDDLFPASDKVSENGGVSVAVPSNAVFGAVCCDFAALFRRGGRVFRFTVFGLHRVFDFDSDLPFSSAKIQNRRGVCRSIT